MSHRIMRQDGQGARQGPAAGSCARREGPIPIQTTRCHRGLRVPTPCDFRDSGSQGAKSQSECPLNQQDGSCRIHNAPTQGSGQEDRADQVHGAFGVKMVGSFSRPSRIQPTSVMAPTQNNRVDCTSAAPVPVPSLSAAARMRRSTPNACPIAEPTNQGYKYRYRGWMPAMRSTPIYRVNKPMAEKTTVRRLSGTRCRNARPIPAPMATVMVLNSVPNM